MRSVELLEALEQSDWETRLAALGWDPVLRNLRYWRKRLTAEHLEPYASLLGDEDPEALAAAIRSLAGNPKHEYRPGPADIYVVLHPPAPESAQQQGRQQQPRADQDEVAYAAVRLEIAAGGELCECVPRSPQWVITGLGVLRCPDCQGLEPGQYDAAMAAEADDPDEGPSAADIARWAREIQAERAAAGKPPSRLLDRLSGRSGNGDGRLLKPMPEITEADRQRERETMGWE